MYKRKWNGIYGLGWNRCECGLPLKLTKANNLVHLHGRHSQKSHDLVMRMKGPAQSRRGATPQ
jgi:hypothetical protein